MATILFYSSKGGVGKTTSALLLSIALAQKAPVVLVDADPNKPMQDWAAGDNVPKNLTILSDVTLDTLPGIIKEWSVKVPFVIVDVEGVASFLGQTALAMSNFVVIPTQGSTLDASQVMDVIQNIELQETKMHVHVPDYKIPYKILLTRTNSAIRARTLSHIEKSLTDEKVPVFAAELNEREAFRAIFSYRKPLEMLSAKDVPNIDKAIANVKLFADELIEDLRALR